MRRQSLSQVEEYLNDMPSRDDETIWFAPDGSRITAEISLYEWHEGDVMQIVHRTKGKFSTAIHFRHEMTR
jgi:hypothetical protein